MNQREEDNALEFPRTDISACAFQTQECAYEAPDVVRIPRWVAGHLGPVETKLKFHCGLYHQNVAGSRWRGEWQAQTVPGSTYCDTDTSRPCRAVVTARTDWEAESDDLGMFAACSALEQVVQNVWHTGRQFCHFVGNVCCRRAKSLQPSQSQ
jgi:hypothetical protein